MASNGGTNEQAALLLKLPSELKMAREYAVLGNYETSLRYFETVTGDLARYMRFITDSSERQKWAKIKEDVQSEVKLVKEIIRELSVFRHPPGSVQPGGRSSRVEDGDDGEEQFSSAGVRRAASMPKMRGDDVAPGRKPAIPTTGASAAGRKPSPGPSLGAPSTSAPSGTPAWTMPKSSGGAGPGASAGSASGGPGGVKVSGGGGGVGGRASVGGAGAGKKVGPSGGSYSSGGSGTPAPAASGGARGGKAASKPPLPKSSGRHVGKDGHSGAPGSAGGNKKGRQKYSEVNTNPADKELIALVESDMLDVNPNVHWDDIAGLEDPKGLIQEAVVLPMIVPNYFQGIRRPWKGVLLFGPPGTGKTLLAKAVATECGTTFFNVSTSTLASKWRGESERMVRLLFEMARHYAPSVIFFDEIDSLAGSRGGGGENEASRRVKVEMLVQMDGISSITAPKGGDDEGEEGEAPAMKQVVVLAASNLPWELDEAFRRRFEKRIYIPLPSLEDREKLFTICLKDISMRDDMDLHKLALATEGYSGADVANVCRDAAMVPMRKMMALVRGKGLKNVEDMKKVFAEESGSLQDQVGLDDFVESISKVSSSVGGADVKKYADWMEEFGAS